MKSPDPQLLIWRQNIRYSGIVAIAAMVIAAILLRWIPFSASYLVTGSLGGVLAFIAVLLQARTGWGAGIVVLLLAAGQYEARRSFVFSELGSLQRFLIPVEFFTVVIAIWFSLIFLFRRYLLRR